MSDVEVSLRCEGWGRPMYGTFGVLPPEAHSVLGEYKAHNIRSYALYDSYQVNIPTEVFVKLQEMHDNIDEKHLNQSRR